MIYLIVEDIETGSRDSSKRLILGCDSVYGGDPFPFFSGEAEAEEFIEKRKDGFYPGFKVISLANARDTCEKIRLEIIKPVTGIVNRSFGDIIDYSPWDNDFHGLPEPERVKKGIFVLCYGMGEFQVLKEGIDCKVL